MVGKRVLAAGLAVVMALSFASCGNKSDGASGNTNKPTVQESGAASQGQTGGQTSESQGQNGEAAYDYTPGVLNTVVDKNGDPVVKEFHINGLQIYSNLEGEEEYEKAWVNPVYKTSGIKSDLGEGYTVIQADLGDKVWDTDTDYYNQIQENLRIVIAPHKELDAYLEMSQDEREAYWDDAVWKSGANAYCALSWDGAPRLADFLIYGTDDTSMRFGTKDILFIWKDQIAHYIVVNYWPEEEYEAKGFTNDFGDGAGSDTTSAGGNGSAGSGSEGNGSGGSIDFSKFDDVDLTWPDEAAWASVGLPNLPYDFDANDISIDTDGKYVTISRHADGGTEDSVAKEYGGILEAAGITGEWGKAWNYDMYESYYAYYKYNGVPMFVQIGKESTGSIKVKVEANKSR